MSKKTVRFSGDVILDPAWRHALVKPIDHPGPGVSNTVLAKTSPVLYVWRDEDGIASFETENTFYVRDS